MDDETHYKRFIILVLLFVRSIVFLILIPNLICILIGWDGLGITSFLLVIYYQNNKSIGAGIVTALVNRIGDVLLLIVIGILVRERSWLVFKSVSAINYSYLGLFLIFGCITKRAQIPFSAWLPAAMAAPTPVSSLVHSSTLVTAGVYVLYRCNYLFSIRIWGTDTLKVLSLCTLVIAGSAALVERDLKKVIALSTLSQLRIIIFSLSLGLTRVTFFHLVTHASFKALLFLCAGVVIHVNLKTQDIRSVGKNWSYIPVSIVCLTVANISLCGIPFLRGFYSKDLIIELRIIKSDAFIVYIIEILGTLFTSWYSLRLSFRVIFGLNSRSISVVFGEEALDLKICYFFLLVGSIIIGWVISRMEESLNIRVQLFNLDKRVARVLFFFALLIYRSVIVIEKGNRTKRLFWFLGGMWNLKRLTTQLAAKTGMNLSNKVTTTVEKGWLEKIGPQGVFCLVRILRKVNQSYQHYSFFFILIFSLFLLLVSLVFGIIL